ncbi:MAG: TatD family hydrolase, partial [Oligoflexia bacterium]|nr:TatD family hydrolase [Oligoflexia bacterium]
GVATRKGYESLKKAVVKIPPASLVLETDSPDQPPACWPGLNEPATLLRVAETVAALRKESPEALLLRSAENLRRVFKI